jgi:hypothetical protein
MPTGYARPKAATPVYFSLVPAYQPCESPNETHAAPLSFDSCNPPSLVSPNLTIGTPDSNGARANSVGFVKMRVLNGDPTTLTDDADVAVDMSLTDVRNQGDLSDYTGELQSSVSVQLTDRNNGSAGDGSGTSQAFDFPITVPCSATPDPGIGGACAIATTFDAIVPGSTPEGTRAIWALDQVQVNDGGSDGLVSTPDNSLFARGGIFVP